MEKNRSPLTLNIFLAIVLTDIFESLTQLFFKKGTIAVEITNVTLANFFDFAGGMITNGNLWLGILFFLANFIVWMVVLSRIDLSIAFPVGSTSHILVPLAAMFFLGESVSPLRWAGIFLIVAGICLIQRSSLGREEKTA